MLCKDLTAAVCTSEMHCFRACPLIHTEGLQIHGGTVVYGACNSDKQGIVPYFGSGVYVFDFVNEYLVFNNQLCFAGLLGLNPCRS